MKVLWFTTTTLIENSHVGSGSWVAGMYDILKKHTEVELAIVSKSDNGKEYQYTYKGSNVYRIPIKRKVESKHIQMVSGIILREQPDIIQVWGTEDVWGLIPFKEICRHIPTVLDMQGVIYTVAREFQADLTWKERMLCWSLKEFLKPSSSLYMMQREYKRIVDSEIKVLKNFEHISCQSKWVKAYVRAVNTSAKLYDTGIALRDVFYMAPKWLQRKEQTLRIFSTAIDSQPLKGLYTLMKAFAIIHRQYPESELVLAGVRPSGIRRGGFSKLLGRYAKRNGMSDSIKFLGKLSAEQLAEQYRLCSVFVNPSFVESYSMVVTEAMYIGTPVVASFSGAMGELGENKEVLYFPKGDAAMCAYQILQIYENPKLASQMSYNGMTLAKERQSRDNIARKQYSIYQSLLEDK